MVCDHKWIPMPTETKEGLVTEGYYSCAVCKIIGSRDFGEDRTGKILMERCQAPDCIAPANHVAPEGIPLCARCYRRLK